MSQQVNEMVYLGGEVTKSLGIARSSLTKYCIALENKDYKFIRGSNNSRAFRSKDVLLLQRMKDLVQDKGMTMETAVNVVLSMLPEEERTGAVLDENKAITSETPSKEQEENNQLSLLIDKLEYIDEISDRLNSMEKELKDIKTQNKLLQDQNDELKTTIETGSSKRDETLLSLIREVQDTKKMIAASQEKKWWEFWK
ncbi:DUF3967 domain-containing protein (plasmid) [Priestia megaterium]|uniref:DUF3967 domain-containing protein n=1 Tax=Priestia megaterium TaxID=1404 RepID=A0AAX6BT90_PRIMG|nr:MULTISPECIES: DUF3967 domain-containing protein [Priestia]MDN4634325.1 DUF3967 domain-containing protein [Sphingomonas sp. PsM26]HES8074051.1 DUF3967 domain-containing protein [Streptococcus pyogenes]MBY0201473.1 DUF3967 domain-containing protein [Priestia megaterium]MCU7713147.1 DUF3967 domain-containing protein [Priestia megaterium]MCW1049152.1 DUF3967 domain-containing protein [Priestia sp. JV24]